MPSLWAWFSELLFENMPACTCLCQGYEVWDLICFCFSSRQWQEQQAQDAGGGQGVLLAVPWPTGDGVRGGGQAVLIAHGSSKPLTFSRYPGKGDWACLLLSDCGSWSLCWRWRWPSSSYSTKLQQALNLPQVPREWRLGLAMLGTEYVEVTRQSLSIRLSTLPRYPERGDWVFVFMSDCGSWSLHNTQLQQTLNPPQVPRERWLGLCSHEWLWVLEPSQHPAPADPQPSPGTQREVTGSLFSWVTGPWSPHNTQLQQTLNPPQVPWERWLGLCSHEWQRVLETS